MKTLKQLREENLLTQKQVAQQANTTITFISLLENGKRNASDEMKIKLAKIYNCEATDIFSALQLTQG